VISAPSRSSTIAIWSLPMSEGRSKREKQKAKTKGKEGRTIVPLEKPGLRCMVGCLIQLVFYVIGGG
jgi:hypothetical protein